MKIAVITGASSGIGREFALLLDRLQCVNEIWLIARRLPNLESLAGRLQTKVRILPYDLTESRYLADYKKLLAEQNAEVDFLINCAGFGKFGSVSSQNDSDIDDMIRLNVTATVMMCKYTLPYMLCGGKIINMSSVTGWVPLPYFNVYAATKAFVYHFSKSLGVETSRYGVSVTAVCPYWMNTEFIPIARDTRQGDAVNRFFLLYHPAPVAAQALADAVMGKTESLYGVAKWIRLAARTTPTGWSMKLWNHARKTKSSACTPAGKLSAAEENYIISL